MITFSNPRLLAEFDDWPSGRERVQCRFEFEHNPKRGYRIKRTTTDKHGRWCKPKVCAYSGPGAIVDGSDGRTYIIQQSQYGFVQVWSSDLMNADERTYIKDKEAFKDLIADAK